ncbi:MAG: hypothetical protein AB1505_03290 [Candidatus Latescibacterota bacterium]
MFRLLACAGCALLVAAPLAASQEVLFVESPLTDVDQMIPVLEAADVRVMLPLGYSLVGTSGALSARAGVLEVRVYTRPEPGGGGRTIEVGVATGPSGKLDIVLAGEADRPNPDLPTVQEGMRQLTGRARATRPGEPEPAFEMFRLGHIEADRAIALLKALGYHTIEFEEKSAQTGGYARIFEMVQGKSPRLPWVVQVVNAGKTSLLEDAPAAGGSRAAAARAQQTEGAPQLGGSHLHHSTTGAPEERLLLVYDRNNPEGLERLLNLLQTDIDVPAQQIVIEAQVIEVNTSKLQDIGIELSASRGSVQGSYESPPGSSSRLGTFIFSRNGFTDYLSFRGRLQALTEAGDAEVLSSPSVLVLNDRQARIQVGRQIPVSKTTATTATVSKGIEYFPVGIVLNLRPRINREQSEVTMQIETIISSISTESARRLEAGEENVTFSPIVDNRLVETYVRVADGTPFIIGGLLSNDEQETRIGLPVISAIPVLGRLFSRERVQRQRREVIVVITPHIVPLEEKSFSYVIPKDSDLFDRFETRLFRNAYRVRDDEVWDLEFITESPVLQGLRQRVQEAARQDVLLARREPFHSLLQGQVPGEEVLVHRMLYEIIDRLGFHREVKPDQVFLFTPSPDPNDVDGFSDDVTLQGLLRFALDKPSHAVVLRYEARPVPPPGKSFTLPLAAVSDTVVQPEEMERLLRDLNRYEDGVAQQSAIVLSSQDDVERLRKVLILKLVLALNTNVKPTLQAFRPGVQILFPTRDDMRSRYHLIDRDAARLFYETKYPYQVTEAILNRTAREVEKSLGGGR